MFTISHLCIRKRETVSYQQYVYILCFVHEKEGNCIILNLQYVYDNQKEGNCIIPTVCLCSRFYASGKDKLYYTNNMSAFCICVSERGKLYHTYSMLMI